MKKKLAEWINIVFGFRKFILILLLYFVGIVFRVKDLISGAEMVDMFKTTTLAFMGANGVEHIIGAIKGKGAQPAEDVTSIPVDEGAEAAVEERGGK